jgi:hypothetical protein
MNLIMQEELDLLVQNCENQDKNFKCMQLICYYMRDEDRDESYVEFTRFLRNKENRNFVIQAISSGKYQDLNDFTRRFLKCVQNSWHFMTISLSAVFISAPITSATVFATIDKLWNGNIAISLGMGFAVGMPIFILTLIIGHCIAKSSKNNPRFQLFRFLDSALEEGREVEEERKNDSFCLYSVNEQSVDEQSESAWHHDILEQ